MLSKTEFAIISAQYNFGVDKPDEDIRVNLVDLQFVALLKVNSLTFVWYVFVPIYLNIDF